MAPVMFISFSPDMVHMYKKNVMKMSVAAENPVWTATAT
jgi:hypothetical protein